ncbi:MAG: amidase [Thermomicrobiales bacterium]
MVGTEPIDLTLAEAAAHIRQRTISPVELVDALLDRIAARNPALNAYITVLTEPARRDAQRSGQEIAAGDYRGPLHGIPLSLKDLVYARGIRTTAGSRVLRDFVPTFDATIASRLREAGAVLVAKANMLEFAYGEVHPDYGPSCNPWHLGYGTSGSSSGSGASVAAGLDFGSVGSDTGGSIRGPATYCGIVGLKPTYGRVSRYGVVPLSWTLDHLGPMTRTVRDAAMLLQGIAGHDPADPGSARVEVPDFQQFIGDAPRLKRVGVIVPEDDDCVVADVRRETERAVAALADAGYETIPVRMPHPVQATRVLIALLYIEASTYHRPWLETRRDEYSRNTRDRLELGALLPGTLYVRAQRLRRVVIAAYRELFRDVDFLAMPESPDSSYRLEDAPADPVLESGDRFKKLCRFSGPFNVTGLPAISVPCGFADNGMPVGLQLVARPFAEPDLFHIADILERQVGRFGRPVFKSESA